MKAYTDIEQSKKLAEILPIESADMYRVFENNAETRVYHGKMPTAYFICKPCWSLAALLDRLKIFTTPTAFSVKVCVPLLRKTNNGYSLTYAGDYALMHNNSVDIAAPIEMVADNPIDVCVEMIIYLHELNLL